MKNNNLFTSVSLLFFICVLCSSCNDMKLAKEASGKWECINIIGEDGIKEKTYYEFGTVEGNTPGGSLKETTYFTQSEDYGDGKCNVKYKSIIQGTWEIIAGDIYFTYDLSTLKVSFEGVDYPDMDKFSESIAQGFIKNYGQSLIQEDINEMKEELYSWYSENDNNEDCYRNVKIKGNNMSFKAQDAVVKLVRIK